MEALWILKGIAFVVGGVLLLSWIVMRLWNWLIPSLFKGPVLQFKHAVGVLVLSKILFGGFGGGGHWRGHHGHHHQAQCQEYKQEVEKKK